MQHIMPGDPTNRMLIVDGHAYAYRAFYAIRQLASPQGLPTNAIYGFIKMLARMRTVLEPAETVVVWDGGLSAERMALLPEYKAQRPPMPAGLEQQLDEITGYLGAAGFASLCHEGVEADDWIAALAWGAVAAGRQAVIASSDKDFMQLVAPGIGLLNPNDKTEAIWGVEQVRQKTGVEPAQVVDWLSLIGDAVDNIPGVPGVGPKTATDLIKEFGSVDGIYQRLASVKSDRLRGNLQGAEAAVRRNQKMIRLHADLPAPALALSAKGHAEDPNRLGALYSRWGFKTLLRELETARAGQKDLFAMVAGLVVAGGVTGVVG
jgi:DNA polymerase-1